MNGMEKQTYTHNHPQSHTMTELSQSDAIISECAKISYLLFQRSCLLDMTASFYAIDNRKSRSKTKATFSLHPHMTGHILMTM